MTRRIFRLVFLVLLLSGSLVTASAAEQRAVFAGGCFWGVEGVFEHVKGVIDVRSGYAGGSKATASYSDVSSGETTHAESVEIRFDPAKVTYEQLLNIFFFVVHDPTEVDRQGPDEGPQYRSVVFYLNANQKRSADTFIANMEKAKIFERPVATKVAPFVEFFPAEDYHQDFMKKNPDHPYVVAHDLRKLDALKQKFPEQYRK